MKDGEGGQSRREILLLVASVEVKLFEKCSKSVLGKLEVLVGKRNVRPVLGRLCLEDEVAVLSGLADDDWNLRFDDAGFLGGNLGNRVSEYVAVVQSYVSDYAQLWRYDVGAVKPPSEPCLDDREIHSLLGEPPEGERGGDLEERQVQFVKHRPPSCTEFQNILLRNQPLPDNPCSLPEVQQMRRCVKPDFVAHGRERRRQHIANRPLAVRPRDMHALVVPVRMPES